MVRTNCACVVLDRQKEYHLSHLMRLWYFSSSVNSFFKRACKAIHPEGQDVRFFLSDPSPTSTLRVCEQRRLWLCDKYYNLMSWVNFLLSSYNTLKMSYHRENSYENKTFLRFQSDYEGFSSFFCCCFFFVFVVCFFVCLFVVVFFVVVVLFFFVVVLLLLFFCFLFFYFSFVRLFFVCLFFLFFVLFSVKIVESFLTRIISSKF